MKVRSVIAFGIGYVLGARAGRERYEQLKRWYDRVSSSSLGEKLRSQAESGIEAARNAAANGVSMAADQVRRVGE